MVFLRGLGVTPWHVGRLAVRGKHSSGAAFRHARRWNAGASRNEESQYFVTAGTKIDALAGALFACVSELEPKAAGAHEISARALPVLEAMGERAISKAVNSVALCNHLLGVPPSGAAHPLRVSFVPSVRVFVDREKQRLSSPSHVGRESFGADAITDEHIAGIRRSMQFQLCTVKAWPGLSPDSTRPADARVEDEDTIRVAVKTDVRRLSGLITTRWKRHADDPGSPPVAIQAMGPKCVEKMVKALAMAWQRSVREFDVEDEGEAGFRCLPAHLQLPVPEEQKEGTHDRGLSIVECRLVRPSG